MNDEAPKRRRLNEGGGRYFAATDSSIKFIRSGCTVLDQILGGGWPLGRVANIVGDKATGKTLLAIEAMANFAIQYPNGKIRYFEAEAAFSPNYAAALGLPVDRVEMARSSESSTVEDVYEDLSAFLQKLNGAPGLYILDSLDALSDEAEMGRDFSEASYGMGKAKQMSQLFRRITGKVENSKVCLIIISQTRANIGVTFGKKYTRSGGSALDFYASQIIYLAHVGEIGRTVNGVKRTVGVEVKVRCTKNKISLPFRSGGFPIIFSFGIEDVTACISWLEDNKLLQENGFTEKEAKEIKRRGIKVDFTPVEYRELRDKLSSAVKSGWKKIEVSFLPKMPKYGAKEDGSDG